MDEFIRQYFRIGISNNDIIATLSSLHSVEISKRTLKRRLKKLQLWRRKNYTDVVFIDDLLNRSGNLHGYKWIHLRCLQCGFVVTQNTVRQLLHVLDPEGIALRKRNRLRRRVYYSRGPNFVWHLDGYDKLTPYGIGIHGCIDGFSRFIIWLEAYKTNHDPRLVAGNFMSSIKILGGCPRKVRCDLGTENGHMGQMQIFLRENDHSSFVQGRSCHNQRIEAWWNVCRKESCQFWMDIFEALKAEGHFNGSFLDKSLIQFCFMNAVQEELNHTVTVWNSHRIRASRNQTSPNGRPCMMYAMPEVFGTEDYLCKCNIGLVTLCQDETSKKSPYPCDETVFELCCNIMEESNVLFPTDAYLLVDLYIFLRESIFLLLDRNEI